MIISCKKTELLKGVNIVSKAVTTKSSMPILECILIDASTNDIRLTGNDTELAIETTIEGEIEEEGAIAIDAKILSDIVRKLPDNEIKIETEDNYKITITCEKAVFNISGRSGEDFSKLPSFERDDYITLTQFTLKEVIQQTIFSISDSDSNKIMTGELFDIKNNQLTVASLDGHRISIRNIELKNNYPDKKVIVPGKTLQDISKIIGGDANENVNIYFSDNYIVFEFDRTTVVSRLIEGEYFKIDQMLSSDYETKFTINKREFLSCIDRATLMTREGDKKPIIMNIGDDNIKLMVKSNIGSMDEEIDIKKEGKDIRIGFNPKFFIDALRVIDEDEVTLYMVNPKAPCFIKDEKENYIYLILPVNITA